MLFIIIRIIFLSIVFLVSFLLIRKSRIINKFRWSVVAFVIATVITTISALIPIENAFITFSSPESAYSYKNYGDVKLVVDGEKSDFVVGAKDDTDNYLIIPRSNDGWKLGMGLDTKRVYQTVSDGITIYVYQYKNTDDYYITVLDTNGGFSDITDNRNSIFKYSEKQNSTLDTTFYTYYAYINNFNEQYVLSVNGNLIKL